MLVIANVLLLFRLRGIFPGGVRTSSWGRTHFGSMCGKSQPIARLIYNSTTQNRTKRLWRRLHYCAGLLYKLRVTWSRLPELNRLPSNYEQTNEERARVSSPVLQVGVHCTSMRDMFGSVEKDKLNGKDKHDERFDAEGLTF